MIGTCPRCGQPVYEGKKNFACSDRSCGFVLWKNDRFWTSRKKELTKKMAADLLKKVAPMSRECGLKRNRLLMTLR